MRRYFEGVEGCDGILMKLRLVPYFSFEFRTAGLIRQELTPLPAIIVLTYITDGTHNPIPSVDIDWLRRWVQFYSRDSKEGLVQD